jgi:hypothetical protein
MQSLVRKGEAERFRCAKRRKRKLFSFSTRERKKKSEEKSEVSRLVPQKKITPHFFRPLWERLPRELQTKPHRFNTVDVK